MNYTDEQIIKAWKCCCPPSCNCKECPMQGVNGCWVELKYETLNLNKRLKAENEGLKEKLKDQRAISKNFGILYIQAKSEARKEFAERLLGENGTMDNRIISAERVKNLLEEMEQK